MRMPTNVLNSSLTPSLWAEGIINNYFITQP